MATWEAKPNVFKPCYLKCDPRTSGINITWELLDKQNFSPHPKPTESAPAFEQEPQGFVCSVKFEKHYLKEFLGQDYAVFQKDTSQIHSHREEEEVLFSEVWGENHRSQSRKEIDFALLLTAIIMQL